MGWFQNQKDRNEKYKADRAVEKGIKESEKAGYQSLLKSAGKPYATGACEYLGGHPSIQGKSVGSLSINNKGVFFSKSLPFSSFVIPVENIIKVESKTDTQISKDVTLTRLVLLGIFAFGVKKKSKEEHNYLVLTYKEDGIENTIIFEATSGILGSSVGTLTSAIMKARQEYAKEHPDVNQSQHAQSTDTISQLERLASLKEKGILSEEEFQSQKGKILNL